MTKHTLRDGLTRSLPLVLLSALLVSPAVWAQSAQAGQSKLGYGFARSLAAGQDYVTGDVIIGYPPTSNPTALMAASQALGGRAEKTRPGSGALLLNFGSEAKAVAALRVLAARPDVLYIERNGFLRVTPEPMRPERPGSRGRALAPKALHLLQPRIQSVSTDPATGFQWHLPVIRKTAVLPALSAVPPTVGVLDTGVDYTHPDLVGKVLLGKNTVANTFDPFDDNGHGTHVAGLIAAKAANAAYGEGVCPNCKILAIKVLDAQQVGTFYDIADGLAYARTWIPPAGTPALKVVNISFTGPYSQTVAAQVLALKTAGKLLVAAAGDDNLSTTAKAHPGADPNTGLRVMATEQNDCRAWFSNFSPTTAPGQYNIAAPGWRIPSIEAEGGYATRSSTTAASAVVAGAAALTWGQLPSLTRDQLITRLLANGKLTSCGFPVATRRVDVQKAITGVAETALIGRLLDPFTGKAPVPSTATAVARLYTGTTPLKADAVDRSGVYEFVGLVTGTGRSLKGERAAAPPYVNATVRTPLAIGASVVNGPTTDALPMARATGNATITLDWKTGQPSTDAIGCSGTCNGWEFDLAVKLPSGSYIDPANTPGDLLTAPYVKAPRDSWDDLEPVETLVIASAAANGVYKVVVDNWPTGTTQYNDSWTNSLASVQLYNGAAALGNFYPTPPATCGLNRYWYVGNLTKTGTAYTWTNVNTCSNVKP